jgi:MFS family permease
MEGVRMGVGARAASWRRVGRTFEALRIPNYRIFFVGQLVSLTGTGMQQVAQAWLVLTLTDSPLALGTVIMLQFLPNLLFSLLGGVLADRMPKRRLMLVSQSVGAGQALALALLTATGQIQLWHVYVLAAVLGSANALDTPTRHSFVTELVGREQLPNAMSLNSTLSNTTRVIGPALGSLALVTFGLAGCFFLNAASFAVVIGALLLLRPDRFFQVPAPPRGSLLGQVREGLGYALRTPEVMVVLIELAVLGSFSALTIITVVLPLLARYTLDAGPTGLGALNSALGAGALVASLWMAYGRRTSQRVLLTMAAALGALLFLASLSRWFPVTAALVAGIGFTSITFFVTANTRLQLHGPDELRGRLASLYTFLTYGATPAGGLIVGGLAERWGVAPTLVLMSGVCASGVAAGLLYLRRHRASRGAHLAAASSPAPPAP